MRRWLRHAIDLADAPEVFAMDDARHAVGGPPVAVSANIRAGGIVDMDIYRVADRLVMIMEVIPRHWRKRTSTILSSPPGTREMAAVQRPIVGATGWAAMTCIYRLGDQP